MRYSIGYFVVEYSSGKKYEGKWNIRYSPANVATVYIRNYMGDFCTWMHPMYGTAMGIFCAPRKVDATSAVRQEAVVTLWTKENNKIGFHDTFTS